MYAQFLMKQINLIPRVALYKGVDCHLPQDTSFFALLPGKLIPLIMHPLAPAVPTPKL